MLVILEFIRRTIHFVWLFNITVDMLSYKDIIVYVHDITGITENLLYHTIVIFGTNNGVNIL